MWGGYLYKNVIYCDTAREQSILLKLIDVIA